MKKIILFLTMSIFLILFVNLISAVGISKYYYTGEPLKLGSGESKTVPVALFMASGEKENKEMVIEVVNSAGIAESLDSKTKVPAGSIDREIKLKFSIGEEVPAGTEYFIDLRVTDNSASKESGMIGFNSVKMVSFPVLVTVPEKLESNFLIWIVSIILVFLIIVIIIYLILRKRKDNKPFKNSR